MSTEEPIVTEHVYPPIPERAWDWMAARKGYCGCGECGELFGRGPTEQAAIDDLLEQEAEKELSATTERKANP